MAESGRAQFPRFLLGFALASVALAGGEWAARSLESTLIPSPYLVQPSLDDGSAVPHPFLLWEERPGSRDAAGVTIEINTMGLRGPEPVRPKPARERRLMVLGDSIGFGEGVAGHQALGQVAVDELGGERVGLKSVNASVPGYSTLQLLNLMDLRGWALEPDVIVVLDGPADREISRFQDPNVVPRVRLSGVAGWMQGRSALVRVLDFHLGVRLGRHRRHHQEILQGSREGNPDKRPRLGPNERARVLRTLVGRAQELGAGVVFLLTPVPEDLAGEVPEGLEVQRQVLRDTAEWSGAKLVEGGEIFAQTGRDASELWLDGVHPTAFGHRVLGRALASTLTQWIRGGAPGGGSRGGELPLYKEPGWENE